MERRRTPHTRAAAAVPKMKGNHSPLLRKGMKSSLSANPPTYSTYGRPVIGSGGGGGPLVKMAAVNAPTRKKPAMPKLNTPVYPHWTFRPRVKMEKMATVVAKKVRKLTTPARSQP